MEELFLDSRNSSTECNECLIKNHFSANLNWAFSFIRFLGLDDRVLKILMLWAFLITWEVSSWSVKMVLAFVLTLCIAELVWNCYLLFIIKLLNENTSMYSHGRGRISDLLNRPIQEFQCLTSTMFLTIFFCDVNTFL
jgi:hypothetical protein